MSSEISFSLLQLPIVLTKNYDFLIQLLYSICRNIRRWFSQLNLEVCLQLSIEGIPVSDTHWNQFHKVILIDGYNFFPFVPNLLLILTLSMNFTSFWTAPVAEPPVNFPKNSPVNQPSQNASFPPNVHNTTVHKRHIHTPEAVMPCMLYNLVKSTLKFKHMVLIFLLFIEANELFQLYINLFTFSQIFL